MTETQRQNPFCVVSKATFGEYAVRDIQTNSSWTDNPYGDEYAIVPNDMVQDILATKGYCDITLNTDGSEVTSFVAREIPEPEPTQEPEVDSEPTTEELLNIILGVNE